MEETKKLKKKLITINVIQALVTVGPFIYYLMCGLVSGDVSVKSKVSLTLTVLFAACLYIINVITKHSMRSPVYILLIGIYVCIKNILPLIMMMLISTVLDELFIDPLKKSLHNRYQINKEIDKRNG